jgi:hypothetical protein
MPTLELTTNIEPLHIQISPCIVGSLFESISHTYVILTTSYTQYMIIVAIAQQFTSL